MGGNFPLDKFGGEDEKENKIKKEGKKERGGGGKEN